jgi:hypothetical protein
MYLITLNLAIKLVISQQYILWHICSIKSAYGIVLVVMPVELPDTATKRVLVVSAQLYVFNNRSTFNYMTVTKVNISRLY